MVSEGIIQQMPSQILNDGYMQVHIPTISITSDVLDFLRYEGLLRTRGKKPSKKE